MAGATVPPTAVTVRNMSPKVVTLRGRVSTIVLPPLGECQIDAASTSDDFDIPRLTASPYLDVDLGAKDSDDVLAVAGIAVWIAIIGAIFVAANTAGWTPIVVWLVLSAVAGAIVGFVSRKSSWGMAGRWAREKAALLLVVLVGFGIPAVVLLYATGLIDYVQDDPGALVDGPLNQVVMYRILQAVFLGLATTFPALLYFLFDRQNTDTLRTRFLLALFRLDDRLQTARDWNARYGRQVTEAFGKHRAHGTSRLFRARRAPVVVATVVIAIGWVLAFLNLDAVSLDGTGEVLADGSLLRLYEPERGVVAFGFLGAYFFGVNTVLRSYLRGDLRPKAYAQITTRVLIVIVLSSLVAITPLGDDAVVLAVAFFAGIVPDTVLQWIWEKTRGTAGERLDELQPLTKLEGIDLYDRARLAEEGVTNVESLAHGDLVDLLLQTRIPPGRLLDWVDQAVLQLQAGGADETDLVALRQVGVRSATDLLTVTTDDEDTLLAALGSSDDDVARARLRVLVLSIKDAEWVPQLLHWRSDPTPAEETVDGRPTVTPLLVAPVETATATASAPSTGSV